MSLAKELDKLKFDKRLLDWHVSRGTYSQEELTKYLNTLPDLATNVDAFELGDEAHSGSDQSGSEL